MTYYELLRVRPDADLQEVKAAYRAAARDAHPDRGGSPDAMVELNAAWRALSDPARRAAYDARLAQDKRRDAADLPGELLGALHPSTWSGLAYLLPFPAFPLAFFVGRQGLWALRFHAAQAVLGALILLPVAALSVLWARALANGLGASPDAGAAAVGVLWTGMIPATQFLLATAAADDLEGRFPLSLPWIGPRAARLADLGGARTPPDPDAPPQLRVPGAAWTRLAYLLPVPAFPLLLGSERPDAHVLRVHAALAALSAARIALIGIALGVLLWSNPTATVRSVAVPAALFAVVLGVAGHLRLLRTALATPAGRLPRGAPVLGPLARRLARRGD